MQEKLQELYDSCQLFVNDGKLATYIPKLATKNLSDFGVCIVDGSQKYAVGDFQKTFTIQSICKPFLLLLSFLDNGEDEIRSRVGVEATGKPFNAIMDYADETIFKEHINPMVNIGAIVVCSLLKGNSYKKKFERFLEFLRALSNNPNLNIDKNIYLSEKKTADKNRALAYLLKSSNVIKDDVEELLDVYFKACSILVTCEDLANLSYILAHHGVNVKNERIADKKPVRIVNTILATCGMYDGSGDFALRVGIPAKSGVSGGIMALAPNRLGIGIYSPGLDKSGNSLAGIKLLEKISNSFDLSIF